MVFKTIILQTSMVYKSNFYGNHDILLVGGLEHVFDFPYIRNVIIPTDGRYITNQKLWIFVDICWYKHLYSIYKSTEKIESNHFIVQKSLVYFGLHQPIWGTWFLSDRIPRSVAG